MFLVWRSLAGDWTQDLPHSKQALYHLVSIVKSLVEELYVPVDSYVIRVSVCQCNHIFDPYGPMSYLTTGLEFLFIFPTYENIYKLNILINFSYI